MLSIIVVFRIRSQKDHALWDLTAKSINGILETADQDYELIIIDNGSLGSEYTEALVRSSGVWGLLFPHIQGTRIIRMDRPESLSKAWNTGVHQADGEYIILANNDIVYHQKGWMTRMIEPFDWEDRRIGIVGIQHMSWYKWAFVEGSLFAIPTSFREMFDLREVPEENDPPYAVVFDEQFTLSCEDVDFNYRVQQAGYETIQVTGPALQPTYLQHLGHRTIQSLSGTYENIITITHENRVRLCRKYGYPDQVVD